MPKEKVVLAYSGGLDTSIIIPWLLKNYSCEVIAFVGDVAKFMGLKAPVNTMQYPKEFITALKVMNNGRHDPARDVRDSPWRDRGAGVLPDLGSHLLDTALFWFGALDQPFTLWTANRFENRAFDHMTFGAPGPPVLEMEATLVSWRNHFTAGVYGEKGSAQGYADVAWVLLNSGEFVFNH